MDVGTYVPEDEKNIKEVIKPAQWFSKDIKIQTGGTCGTYSAVALAEAHCNRFAQVHVNISESYQVYRLISDLFRDSKGKIVVDAYNQYVGEDSWPEKAFPQVVLERIKSGNVATTEEFSDPDSSNFVKYTQEHFSRLHKDLVKNAAEAAKKAGKKIRYLGDEDIKKAADLTAEKSMEAMGFEMMSLIDDRAEAAAHATPYDGDEIPGVGIKMKTQDPNMRKCLETVGEVVIGDKPDTALLKKWLDASYPVVCIIHNADNISSTFDTYKLYSKSYTKMHHSTILYGYRYSPKSKRTEFLVRDSNFATLSPYSVSGCDTMVAINPKSEEVRKPDKP